ncbi:MAG: class I SAM-dependent methyltransferase [Prochlorotrichaceae cyanobacterium]
MSDWSFPQSLQHLRAVFDLNQLLKQHYDYQKFPSPQLANSSDRQMDSGWRRGIVQYYKQSGIGYRKYHSVQGSIHLAINETNEFDPDGYYTQPRKVAEEIQALQAKTVLEVGCGMGFNSRFLAEKFAAMQFLGLDLSPENLRWATRSTPVYPNLQFRQGDFNQTGLAPASQEVVFAIECLCYAPDISVVLSELYRVLRSGGRLIIYDGYRCEGFDQQSDDYRMATQLAELGMALPQGFRTLQTWLDIAQSVGFRTIVCDNQTAGVLPNLRHLQKRAEDFLKRSWQVKLLNFWRPYLCGNTISGLLLAFICDLDQGTHCYYHWVLEKP